MGIEAINLKFNWARTHFEVFNSELAEYLKVDPCKFVAKPNITTDKDGRRWVTGTFEAVNPIPEPMPLIVGDCLSNLRSTLDYLVWELVLANGKKPKRSNAFPIAHTPDAYQLELDKGRLKGVDPAAIAIIKSLQPYHLPVPDESFLSVLGELTNINKHRRIVLIVLKTIGQVPGMQVVNGQAYAVVDPPTIQGNAEFGPFEVFGDQVKVEASVVAYVAFDEAPVQGFGVYGVLEAISRFLDTKVFAKLEKFL